MATRTTETEPSETDWQAIRGAADAAASLLGTTSDDADLVQKKIQELADGVVEGTVENPLGENLAVALGALWGDSLCEAYGWEWIVPIHGEWRSLGVADRERRYLALPFNLFSRIIDEKDRETPGSFVRYKAIGANHLPESEPGRYTIITS